jgi:hypothetical protein
MKRYNADPSLFRAQRAEEEVRQLRTELTSFKVQVLCLNQEVQRLHALLRGVRKCFLPMRWRSE